MALESFELSDDGVRVSLGDGSVVHGRGLVGADGIGSVVAATLQPGLVLSEIDLGPYILARTPHSVLNAPYHRMSFSPLRRG